MDCSLCSTNVTCSAIDSEKPLWSAVTADPKYIKHVRQTVNSGSIGSSGYQIKKRSLKSLRFIQGLLCKSFASYWLWCWRLFWTSRILKVWFCSYFFGIIAVAYSHFSDSHHRGKMDLDYITGESNLNEPFVIEKFLI